MATSKKEITGKDENKKKKGVLDAIWDSLTKTGGCCGSGESCCCSSQPDDGKKETETKEKVGDGRG